jgi:hypothetical protein
LVLCPLTPQKRPRTMSARHDPVAPPTRLDWLTCRDYEQHLERNLEDLHARVGNIHPNNS